MTVLQLPPETIDHVLAALRQTAADIRDEFNPDDDFSVMVLGVIPDRDLPTHLTKCSLVIQRFDADAGELEGPWGRDITIPVLDWDGESDETQPDGAIRVIVTDYVIPWLERHGVAVLEPEDAASWASGNILRSAWKVLPEDA